MAFDNLTTSGINFLVNTYLNNEYEKKLTPLQARITKYNSLSSVYTSLLQKIDSFKSKLSNLKTTGSASPFSAKVASSSNTDFLTATASSGAEIGGFSLRIKQLAKNDLLISLDKSSEAASSITSPGEYTFTIKSGDGEGGQFSSKVTVSLTASDFTNGIISNKKLAEKISKAINEDKAVVLSNSMSGSTTSSGSFKINIGGSETTINYSAGSYESVIDSIVSQLNSTGGVAAEKIVDGSNVRLRLTVTDSSKYISISGDNGSLLNELGISVTKEKGASGLVTSTSFSPSSGLTQISLTSTQSGSGFKIEDISDTSGNLLASFGLNLGTNRTAYVQNQTGEDTAGYVHQLTALNSKFAFNGLEIERFSNTISDLVTGVTISLKSLMTEDDPDVTVNVNVDVKSIRSKIEEFITNFNDLYTYIKSNSKTTEGKRGVLLGNSSASSLASILSTAAYSPVSGISSSEINTLSELGITFDTQNGLSISNSNQLDNAIASNSAQVEALFNSDSGLANTLYDKVKPYTGTGGYIDKLKSSLKTNVDYLNDSIESTKKRIEKSADILRQNYYQLQMQLASLLSSSGNFNSDIFM